MFIEIKLNPNSEIYYLSLLHECRQVWRGNKVETGEMESIRHFVIRKAFQIPMPRNI